MKDFMPYSKEQQLKGHQKPKDTPKFKNQRHNRRRRKPKADKACTYHHKRKIPHWKQRGAIHKNERAEALRRYGEWCWVCGNPKVEMHHIKGKGYGAGGRGKFRNLIPLCAAHHRGENGVEGKNGAELAQKIWNNHLEMYGPHFFKDEYDLFMEGLIENPSPDLFEKFMKGEEQRAKASN